MDSALRLFNRSLCLAKCLSEVIRARLSLRATVSGRQDWDRRAVSLLDLLSWRSDGDVNENSSLVRFYIVATGKQVLTFRKIAWPHSQGQTIRGDLTLKMQALRLHRDVGYLFTSLHDVKISEGLWLPLVSHSQCQISSPNFSFRANSLRHWCWNSAWHKVKGKGLPQHAWTGPRVSR